MRVPVTDSSLIRFYDYPSDRKLLLSRSNFNNFHYNAIFLNIMERDESGNEYFILQET
jgi:hypothetical protein